MTTREQLCLAINGRNLITFDYDSHSRTIEPHVVYPDSGDEWHIEGWQTAGYSSRPGTEPWRRYKIDNIKSLTILDDTFTGTRASYVRDSERYKLACCKL